jgi:putative FmdB family regulatory protein
MPFYDYQCESCKHQWETSHGINEKGPDKCPECGKKKVRIVIGKPPAYHSHYSPMHPRIHRGRGY